jgi:hypothetical protein
MSRSTLALLIGVVGFLVYILVVTALGDFLVTAHWALQLVYYLVAGMIWIIPARRLIVWGVQGKN